MPNIIGVKFKQSGKTYHFASQGIEFVVGDGVIVETSRGTEFAVVEFANTDVEKEKIIGELKPVIRKATATDTEQYNQLMAKKAPALQEAQKCIDKHNLNMKLIDLEFAFDGTKATFYFSADNRVDFRELVKDLASYLHMRIELRQIGIRDECKMKGGLGPCGRPCCCNAYMKDFERVSIKMAKIQGLSLNPTQISGLCGRLMCCLKFENDYYQETLKIMPKVGGEVVTVDGKGVVENADILRQTVNVRVTLPNGDVEIRKYKIDQLKNYQTETIDDSTQDSAEQDEVLQD